MACINKSNERYVALKNRYGDTLAAYFVRGNILDKKLSGPEDFYIPTQDEVTRYFREVKRPRKIKEIQDALTLNPTLSEEGIKTILKRVISKHKGEYYVVKGSNNRGIYEQELVLKEVFENNLKIVNKLAKDYPDIFDVKDTGYKNNVIVTINPRTEAQYFPDIQSSLDTYAGLLEQNEGIQPTSFSEGDHVWQRVGNHTYTLIDASTGDPFLRTVNLLSGVQVQEKPMPLNKENAEQEIMDIRANYDTEFWQIQLGLMGINLEQIINNLEAAETQQEFDEKIAYFKKITC